MVDSIDKSLPNTVEEIKDEEFQEKEVPVPGGEEVITTDTSEVVMDEEGGAEVTFDPTTVPGRQSDGHFANLADTMADAELETLGQTLYDQYTLSTCIHHIARSATHTSAFSRDSRLCNLFVKSWVCHYFFPPLNI